MLSNQIKLLKKAYKAGERVKLIKMEDAQAPPLGTEGTVLGVDDIGNILVLWDSGSSLNVVFEKDVCVKIGSVKITCYGQLKKWACREEALKFYLQAFLCTEGAEQERYLKIYKELLLGFEKCSDI